MGAEDEAEDRLTLRLSGPVATAVSVVETAMRRAVGSTDRSTVVRMLVVGALREVEKEGSVLSYGLRLDLQPQERAALAAALAAALSRANQ